MLLMTRLTLPDLWTAFMPASCLALVIATAALVASPSLVLAQTQDQTGLKRAFLDRYLDCAEAHSDSARLACYDALLIDIPAWLEDSSDPAAESVHTQTKGTAPVARFTIECSEDIKSE